MEKGKQSETKEKNEGLAQAVLKGLGLGKLVKEAEKTALFKKRFVEVNEEIEKKMKKEKG